MNPKELRIGNLVECFGVAEVVLIKKDKIKLERQKRDRVILREKSPIDSLTLCGIPLTEDWLIKFGYTKEGSNFWFIGHIVWEYDDGVFICDKNGITLKYVHQLQNLYFALTGKELTLQNTAE